MNLYKYRAVRTALSRMLSRLWTFIVKRLFNVSMGQGSVISTYLKIMTN